MMPEGGGENGRMPPIFVLGVPATKRSHRQCMYCRLQVKRKYKHVNIGCVTLTYLTYLLMAVAMKMMSTRAGGL